MPITRPKRIRATKQANACSTFQSDTNIHTHTHACMHTHKQRRSDYVSRAQEQIHTNQIVACCFLLLVLVCSIVDGGFWLESCNRTSVLLWTVTSLNRRRLRRRKQRRLIRSASPLYNYYSFISFHLVFTLKRTNPSFDGIKSLIDISFKL